MHNQEKPLLQKETITALLLALLLGILHYYLFYDHNIGLSYPLFVGMFYTVVFWGLRKRIRSGLDIEFMLLLPIFLLALTFLLFANPFLALLNFMVIPMLIVAQTMRMAEVKRSAWHTIQYVADMFKQAILHCFSYFPEPFQLLFGAFLQSKANRNNKTYLKIALGLLIALPLLLIILYLLSSADAIFQKQVSDLGGLFQHVDLGQIIFHAVWIVFVALYIFSYIRGLQFPKLHEKDILDLQWNEGEGELVVRKKPFALDTTIVMTVLVVVNAVYLLFTIVQFSYFFTAGDGALPDGTTYAAYARKGFAELIVVTLINFSLLLSAINWVHNETNRVGSWLRGMLSLLVCSSIVMLISAHLRLSLYEEAYGYTSLRILVHAFMIFLGILLALALMRVWYAKLPLLKQYILVTLASFVLLNFINIDMLITSNNLTRYSHTGKIDLEYIGSLSEDIIPTLVHFNQSSVKKPEGLQELLLRKKKKLELSDHAWQAFNLAKYNARKALNQIS
jgi:hypothetical protein